MGEKPLNVGVSGLLMGFGSLVAHLDAKGLINKNEFAGILDSVGDAVGGSVGAEVEELARVLRDRAAPNLTAIDGGKADDD